MTELSANLLKEPHTGHGALGNVRSEPILHFSGKRYWIA